MLICYRNTLLECMSHFNEHYGFVQRIFFALSPCVHVAVTQSTIKFKPPILFTLVTKYHKTSNVYSHITLPDSKECANPRPKV